MVSSIIIHWPLLNICFPFLLLWCIQSPSFLCSSISAPFHQFRHTSFQAPTPNQSLTKICIFFSQILAKSFTVSYQNNPTFISHLGCLSQIAMFAFIPSSLHPELSQFLPRSYPGYFKDPIFSFIKFLCHPVTPCWLQLHPWPIPVQSLFPVPPSSFHRILYICSNAYPAHSSFFTAVFTSITSYNYIQYILLREIP